MHPVLSSILHYNSFYSNCISNIVSVYPLKQKSLLILFYSIRIIYIVSSLRLLPCVFDHFIGSVVFISRAIRNHSYKDNANKEGGG